MYIYTDGSFRNYSKQATWSFTVADINNNPIEISVGKVSGVPDSNRAELTALLKALEYAEKKFKGNFIIRTDYEVGYKFCSGEFVPKRNSKYNDLYKAIYSLLRTNKGRVRVEKVKAAHNQEEENKKDSLNELVDELTKRTFELYAC